MQSLLNFVTATILGSGISMTGLLYTPVTEAWMAPSKSPPPPSGKFSAYRNW